MMFESDYFNKSPKDEQELYPSFFIAWDEALAKGQNPGYYEVEELCDIIDIYLSEEENDKAKFSIDYAFKLYPDHEELIYEILLLFSDYEMWNDLLALCDKYKNEQLVWADGHKLTALLHLGMEEDAFLFFKKLKSIYAVDKEDLSIIYQAMAEALYELDLFDASIDVTKEAIALIGEDIDLLWLLLQNYLTNEDKENVLEIAEKIQKKNPMNPEVWSRLGNTYQEIGEERKAIEAFEFEQSLGMTDLDDLMSLMRIYEKNGNFNKALEKADEYLALTPKRYIVNLMAANYCSQMGDWEKTIEYIDKAILLSPEVDSLYLYRSDFLLKLGEYKKAIATLEKGICVSKDLQGILVKQLKLIQEQYPD